MRNASAETISTLANPSRLYVTEQDDTIKSYQDFAYTLRKLSGHQHVWYGYQESQNVLFKHDLSTYTYCVNVDRFDLNALKVDQQYMLVDTPLGDLFAQIFLESNVKPCTACILYMSCPDLNHPVYFILFSENQHNLELDDWKILKNYFEQYVVNLELKFENQKLKSTLQELEDINAGRAKYFSVIAHDLRAPFHGILGCADILLHESETLDHDSQYRLTEYLYDTTQSTYGLLENLLNWAMAEGGRFHQKPVHFRVNDVVQTVFDLLCAFAYKKEIKLQCDIDPDLYAFADVRMVTSILQNLTSNALKFTLPHCDKKVQIKAVAKGQAIELSVQDEGIGMNKLQLKKLFQEHTIPSTQGTSGEKGTGLGLVLCKRFLEMNGGHIYADSELNQGTRFVVTLPIGSENF